MEGCQLEAPRNLLLPNLGIGLEGTKYNRINHRNTQALEEGDLVSATLVRKQSNFPLILECN